MLDQLLETGAKKKKSAWGGITSVMVHAVIVAVVVSTAEARPRVKFVGDGPIIRIVPPPPTEQSSTHHGGATGGATPTSTTIPRIPSPGASFDIDRPPVAPVSTTSTGTDSLLSEIAGGGASGPGAVLGGASGAATEPTLDAPVRVIADRTPVYPDMLRSAGIIGAVRIQFVIDTTGRVEPASIRVLDSSHELFTRAVLTALRQSRFTAGEVGGHRVRTLVERSYRFDIGVAR